MPGKVGILTAPSQEPEWDSSREGSSQPPAGLHGWSGLSQKERKRTALLLYDLTPVYNVSYTSV